MLSFTTSITSWSLILLGSVICDKWYRQAAAALHALVFHLLIAVFSLLFSHLILLGIGVIVHWTMVRPFSHGLRVFPSVSFLLRGHFYFSVSSAFLFLWGFSHSGWLVVFFVAPHLQDNLV